MAKERARILPALAVLVFVTVGWREAQAAQTWTRTSLFPNGSIQGWYDMAGLDAGGSPMLIYRSHVPGVIGIGASVSQRENGVWNTNALVPTPNTTGINGLDAAMVGGTPYVAIWYSEQVGPTASSSVGVMALRNNQWVLEHSRPSPGLPYGSFIEIADINGQPAVVYGGADATPYSRTAFYLERDPQNHWTETRIYENFQGGVIHLDLAQIGTNPAVAISNDGGSGVFYATRNAGSWSFGPAVPDRLGFADLIPYLGRAAMFSTNNVTGLNSSSQFYMQTAAGTWTLEPVTIGPSYVVGSELRLMRDVPVVAYFERMGETLHFRMRDAGVWTDQIVDSGAVDETDNMTLFEVNGRPAIAYISAGNGPIIYLEGSQPVPEPGTMMGTAATVVGLCRRWRRQAHRNCN